MISLKPIHLVGICVALSQSYITLSFTPVQIGCPFTFRPHSRSIGNALATRMSKQDDMFRDQEEGEKSVMNTDDIEFVTTQNGEIPDDFIEGMQDSAPSQLDIMKELLGINVFTYILAGLIVFFLSMNLAFGPGWLGQSIGMEGTGTFTQISDSLPDSVDLSKPEFLL